MARYTAEEASELLMNDKNFGEMESADSLDDSFSDSITSYSEVDSDPENDFVGRDVSVTAQQERGRPRTRGLQIRGRVRRGGGSLYFSNIRLTRILVFRTQRVENIIIKFASLIYPHFIWFSIRLFYYFIKSINNTNSFFYLLMEQRMHIYYTNL